MNEEIKLISRRPEGVMDLLPDAAERKRWVENRLLSAFLSWGYRQVVTPTLELEGLFGKGLKAGLENRLYRFPDNRGVGLVLRPDWTLPMARVVATHMKDWPRPLRLCYCGSIFRMISALKGEKREFFQAGVELVGEGMPAGDGEVIALALEALGQVGITQVKVCIGDAGFLTAAISALGLPGEKAEAVGRAVAGKDFVALKNLVQSAAPGNRALLEHLPGLRGGREVLDKARALSDSSGVMERLNSLEAAIDRLDILGAGPQLLIDLSLARGLDYYTGMVFEFYSPYLGAPLGGGGRYDNLLSLFGQSLPATGCALRVDNILQLLNRHRRTAAKPLDLLVCYQEGMEKQAQKEAGRHRREGARTILDLQCRSWENARQEAKRLKVNHLIYISRERVLSEDCS